MKKVLALVLGTMSVSAFADVTLYGKISAALETDQFPSSNQVEPGTTSVQDYGSYFGIRGTDQVYGQTAVVWQVEQFLNITSGEAYQNNTASNWTPNHPGSTGGGVPTTGSNVLASSDSYIGLQGAWGRVRIGNLSNTYRTNTGAVDIFNGSNANVMGTYDRFLSVLPQMLRYDTPSWGNFAASAYVSMNQDGNFDTGGANGNGIMGINDENGYNNSPIYGLGLYYNPGNFSATFNTQLEMNTGVYQTIQNGGSTPGCGPNPAVCAQQGINAYSTRLELNYNNPDSWFVGVGAQIAQGYGYQSMPGNGNMQNLWIQNSAVNNVNSAYINSAASGNGWSTLNTANLGTAELGASFGWHVNNWTPKVGYTYGSNMMSGGSYFDLIAGNNQVGGTGYQQVVAELDWNITPRTIAFVSWGQQWWGQTQQSMIKGNNPGLTTGDSMNAAGGSINVNTSTTAVGFSHTF